MQEKGLALFDIDGTIYDGYLTAPLIEAQAEDGLVELRFVDAVFQARDKFKKENYKYEDAVYELLTIWAEGLKGQKYSRVLAHALEFVPTEKERFFPGMIDLIASLEDEYDRHIITGEPQFVGESVKSYFQMSGYAASIFGVKNGILTGEVEKFIASGQDKLRQALKIAKNYNLARSLGFGDSEADLDMLSLVECPMCVRPTVILEEYAKKSGWRIYYPGEPSVELKFAGVLE